jgi:hypothetical protein
MCVPEHKAFRGPRLNSSSFSYCTLCSLVLLLYYVFLFEYRILSSISCGHAADGHRGSARFLPETVPDPKRQIAQVT